jgi:MFS transporter, FHS family, L-fucose permease
MKDKKQSYLVPLIIIGVLFFIFGFVTWVNGTLITFFKKAFGLTNTSSYLVTFAFFISYTVMAIPSSIVLKKTGFKNGMALGLAVMAIGTLIFIPAANLVSYNLFLMGLFTIGIGLTVLQTASNPYVTIIGPRESAAQRISFMGVANKVAGILSQLFFGSLLLTGTTEISAEESLQKVINPYIILTVVLLILAFLIKSSKNLPEPEEEQEESETNSNTAKTSVFQHPNLVLGVIALFCYVGAEVIAGDTIINYGVSLGFPEEQAKNFGTYTLAMMLLGYFLGIFLIPKFVSQQTWLKLSSLFGVIVCLIGIFTSGLVSVWMIAILGLANAILWPAIWPLALEGIGKFTKIGSALLIMAIAGGAILPLIYGQLADSIGTQKAYFVLIPLYLFILYFSISGHKKKSW